MVFAGLDEPVAFDVVITKLFYRQRETHIARFARLQQDFLKAFQFAHRPRSGGRRERAKIKLRDFGSRACAGIFYWHGGGDGSNRFQSRGAQLDFPIFKRRVSETETERIQRRRWHVHIVAVIIANARTAGVVMIIIKWRLPDVAEKSRRQTADRINLTEQYIGHAIRALRAGKPRF